MASTDGGASAGDQDPRGEEAFERELERRLGTIESPEYRDPAREDLPLSEMVVFTILSAVVVVLVHLWGY
ncbi:hypothetical protein FHX42_003334 [Saccharopolyspora lacisalsi]|uniref:Uncharacterized protein n=1 Tax=Halosaccharopolyspora lacisalsi TaxID=1000566 RepID=A0A839E4Y3_9PSEU|nr:hypothetical protein [Halosaccharopolyspora lacisalsi]MBA8825968.1 hypothetical protein [Halosaccharopolyspora lacisalsi]